MKFFLILSLFLIQTLLANDFSKKKIIKIAPNKDSFNIIDLDQKFQTQSLDKQKALFDSSTLIEKKPHIPKDKNVDFAILIGHKPLFGFAMGDFSTRVDEFSKSFSKNLIQDLKEKINLANKTMNNFYQRQSNLNFFDKELKLVNISSFLDQNQSQQKTIDYVIVVGLNDFTTGGWIFFNIETQEAYAKFSLHIFDIEKKKFIDSKNISINLDLKKLSPQEAADFSLEQIPSMLAIAIENRVKRLKVRD